MVKKSTTNRQIDFLGNVSMNLDNKRFGVAYLARDPIYIVLATVAKTVDGVSYHCTQKIEAAL